MNVFLISFSSPRYPYIERKEIINYLDTQSEIKNWFAVLPNSILVVTNNDINPTDVSKIVTNKFNTNLSFLVTDAKEANGIENNKVWDFINNPKSSGRWS